MDDCEQEVWLAVMKHLPAFEHAGDRPRLRPWLHALVRSKATDAVRRRLWRRVRSLSRLAGNDREVVDRSDDAAEVGERVWMHAIVHSAIDELRGLVSERDFRVFELTVLDHRAAKEVQAQTGVRECHAWQIRSRPTRKLAHLVEEIAGEGILSPCHVA